MKKNIKFVWTQSCQEAFDKLKAILKSEPVLAAPDFQKPFKLAVDASDVGAGGVLLQKYRDLTCFLMQSHLLGPEEAV